MTNPRRVVHRDVDPRIMIFRVENEVDAFVVRTEHFVALIDTMSTPELCQAVLEQITDDLDDRPLVVINTHADWDHVWGNMAVAARAPIIAHETARHRLRDPEATATLRAKSAADGRFGTVRLIEPTVTFRDSLVLHGGDLTLELLHTPGHTPDHLVVWLPELRLCVAGDAAEDPLPEVTEPVPAHLHQLRSSLRRIQELEPTTVLPSHGETTDPDLLTRNLTYFTALADRVNSLSELELSQSHPPGLGFEECVSLSRPLTAPTRAFYTMCHEKAVRASVLERLQTPAS